MLSEYILIFQDFWCTMDRWQFSSQYKQADLYRPGTETTGQKYCLLKGAEWGIASEYNFVLFHS